MSTPDDQLLDELGAALSTDADVAPSARRIAALRAQVVAQQGPPAGEAPEAVPSAEVVPLRPRLPAWGLAVAAAAVFVAGVGTAVAFRPATPDLPVAGAVEYDGQLLAADGVAIGELEVQEAGIGRVIRLRTDALPILPTGELYEVWFVAPDDTPEAPRRISAGTFHPLADGRSIVRFAAAVDPTLYPVLEITAEPGDGDPAASSLVVARTPLG